MINKTSFEKLFELESDDANKIGKMGIWDTHSLGFWL